MKAYHDDPAIKAKYVERMKNHIAADELQPRLPWINGRGYSIGCTFDTYGYARGQIEIGFPKVLIDLEKRLSEGLAKHGDGNEHRRFALAVLEAAEPGADLTLVWHRFAVWLLSEEGPLGERALADCVVTVRNLFKRVVNGDDPTQDEWDASYVSAIDYAATYAAASQAVSVAASVSVAYAAHVATNVGGAYRSMAAKLIELIRDEKGQQ